MNESNANLRQTAPEERAQETEVVQAEFTLIGCNPPTLAESGHTFSVFPGLFQALEREYPLLLACELARYECSTFPTFAGHSADL
jgi:hypothetical protein